MLTFSHAFHAIHSLHHLLIMGYRPPYKGFEDLGLGMNPQSSFLTQIFTLFLLVACFLHSIDWLHADYIGNTKDSFLSL